MTQTQTRPFRAGTIPGAAPIRDLPQWEAELAAGAVTRLADVSEFQPDITDATYLAWSKAIVIRCAYGDAHDDQAWYGGARRAALHAGGVQFLGIYQYLVASQDPVAQADAFIRIVGGLQPGEIPVCDLEEGSGGQAARWGAWRSRILGEYPQLRTAPLGGPMLYSGLYFEEHAGLEAQWVAAYQAAEPTVSHKLWQFTDAYPVPGVGSCDCSLFHGTTAQLRELITPMSAPVPPPPSPELLATRGNESLRQLAHNHGMTVQEVLWWTARLKDGGYGTPGQAGYISAGDWDANVPAGVTWGIGPTPGS